MKILKTLPIILIYLLMAPLFYAQAQQQSASSGEGWSLFGVTPNDAGAFMEGIVAPVRDQFNNVTDTHAKTQGVIEFCRGNDHAFCESLRNRAQFELSIIVEEQINSALNALKNYCEGQRTRFDRMCVTEVQNFRQQVSEADQELSAILLEVNQVDLETENAIEAVKELEQRFINAQQDLDGLRIEFNAREEYCRSFIQVIRTSRDEGCVPAQVDSNSVQPVEVEDARVTRMHQDPTAPEQTVQGRARAELAAPVVRDAPELAETRTYVNDAFYSRGGPQETINTTRTVHQDLMTNGVQALTDMFALVKSRLDIQGNDVAGHIDNKTMPDTAPIPRPRPRPENIGQSAAGDNATGENQVTNNYLDGASYGGNTNGTDTTTPGTGELAGPTGQGGRGSGNSGSSGFGLDLSKLGGFPSYGGSNVTTNYGNSKDANNVGTSPTRYNQGMGLSPSFESGASYNATAYPSQRKASGSAQEGTDQNTETHKRSANFAGNNGMGLAAMGASQLGQSGKSAGANPATTQKNKHQVRRSGGKQIYSQKNKNDGALGIMGRRPASQNQQTLDERMAQLKKTNRTEFDPDKYVPKTEAERLALARATGRRLSGHSQGLQEWPKDIRRLEQAGNLDVFGYMNLQYQMQFRK